MKYSTPAQKLIFSDLISQHIFESVKHSLERLQLDYVDVLQCRTIGLRTASFEVNVLMCVVGHRFDQDTPIAETVRGYMSESDADRVIS